MNDITALAQRMKAAAEKATTLNLDTALGIRDEDGCIECPACGGEGYVDAERDYCNIDNVALGVQFYGIGEHHGLAEEYFRQVVPANVMALVEALEKAHRQIAQVTAERDALREGEIGNAKHSNTRAAADIYFQLAEECDIPAGGSLVEFVDGLKERLCVLESRTVTVKMPARCACEGYHIGEAYLVEDPDGDCYDRDEVIDALRAAGIQVIEGEA